MHDEASDGPRAAVGRLYDRHGAGLYRYALLILADPAAAEDVVQQVFTAVLTGGRVIEQDERYLRRAVRNECYSTLRRRPRDSPAGRILEPTAAGSQPEERLALEAALRGLPPEQREVLHLHVYEGMTFQEIADMADVSVNTVASRYRYALQKLRETLTR
jgi:RNA polymerase sigma-70 factor (ECF subfamily)